MIEDTPIHPSAVHVLTTEDGTVCHCSQAIVGRVKTRRERRWILCDTNGKQYIGPTADAVTLSELRRGVADCGEMKKALGQAGVNAAEMRARIIREMHRDN